MGDELVFAVDGHVATAAHPITLAEAGLLERQHLQEWVLKHPELLAPGVDGPPDVLIVSSEFDRWAVEKGPAPLDRLDVLGLDREGRLVVAELKRDAAPDTVTMQAITYAAMCSRFSEDVLADQLAKTRHKADGTLLSREQAIEELQSHCGNQVTPETLSRPRIVLVATSFSQAVKATVVWLGEMGLDIGLVRVQAYRLPDGQVVISASQLYPLPDVEQFMVRPRSEAPAGTQNAYPEIPWTPEDLQELATQTSATVRTILERCSETPDAMLPIADVRTLSGRSAGGVNSDLAFLTMTSKRLFGRRNWPFRVVSYPTGGSAYVMSLAEAEAWQKAAAAIAAEGASAST